MTEATPVHWWKELGIAMKAQIITVAVLAIGITVFLIVSFIGRPAAPGSTTSFAVEDTIQANSHLIAEADATAPTLVEFLDFECESCAAVYPFTEEIRQLYAGQINYAVRYFPLPGHKNSMTSAIAVEAAAQQGKFTEMYSIMFETQAEWGEGQSSEADRFRSFAEDLGLDMAAFDAAVADPATQARVEEDLAAGKALGVSGTPTFFLDGKELELTMTSDLTDALDQALAR